MENGRLQNRVLVVDDDPRICAFLRRFLSGEGFAVVVANDGRAMRRALADHPFSLAVLDLSFPSGEDGISLARTLRSQYDFPLIMLSGKTSVVDKVVCLEMGADDYVTKPFEPRELLARMRTVMRRYAKRIELDSGEEGEEITLCFAGWEIDPARYTLSSPGGNTIRLTSQEFRVLAALVQRRGRILTREQILNIVANRNWTPYDRSIDVLIGKIRKKLNDTPHKMQFIKTIRGVGYMFAPPERP